MLSTGGGGRHKNEDGDKKLEERSKGDKNDLSSLVRVILYELRDSNIVKDLTKFVHIQKEKKDEIGRGANKEQGILERARSSDLEGILGVSEVLRPALEEVLHEGTSTHWSNGLEGNNGSSSGTSGNKNVITTGRDTNGERYTLFKREPHLGPKKEYIVGIYKVEREESKGYLTLGINKCKENNPRQCPIEKQETNRKIQIVFE